MRRDAKLGSSSCVYLLGAGFSAEFGLPIMRNFLTVAKGNYFGKLILDRRLNEGYSEMLEFVDECQASAWLMNRDWENIEEIYTQADFLRMCTSTVRHNPRERGKQRRDYKELCEHIAWAIWDVYRRFEFPRDKSAGPQAIVRLLESTVVNAGLRPVVITTNYDVAFETAVQSFQNENRPYWNYYYPGFNDREIRRSGFCKEAKGSVSVLRGARFLVPVIKLHGSVNWFRSASRKPAECIAQKILSEPDDFTSGKRERPHVDPEELVNQVQAAAKWTDAGPAIVPPMLGKTTLFPAIELQWRLALEAIAKARRIIVVGYSFPDTDAFMVRLLSEGLSRNRQLDSIRIVDVQPLTKWRSRLRKIFTPMGLDQKVRFINASTDMMLSKCDLANGDPSVFDTFFDNGEWARRINE